jgi:hypothetical protein
MTCENNPNAQLAAGPVKEQQGCEFAMTTPLVFHFCERSQKWFL